MCRRTFNLFDFFPSRLLALPDFESVIAGGPVLLGELVKPRCHEAQIVTNLRINFKPAPGRSRLAPLSD
jgi:hypothetical protein